MTGAKRLSAASGKTSMRSCGGSASAIRPPVNGCVRSAIAWCSCAGALHEGYQELVESISKVIPVIRVGSRPPRRWPRSSSTSTWTSRSCATSRGSIRRGERRAGAGLGQRVIPRWWAEGAGHRARQVGEPHPLQDGATPRAGVHRGEAHAAFARVARAPGHHDPERLHHAGPRCDTRSLGRR